MKIIEGGVTAAKGFEAASTAAKIKYQDRTDMAMIYSQVPCECAGTFTTNVVKAACVKWDQQVVKSGAKAQAVIVNSGIANACTGVEGFGYCKDTADAAAEAAEQPAAPDNTAVSSQPLVEIPREKLNDFDYLIQNFAIFLDLEDPMLAGSPFRYAMKMADVFYREMEKNKDWIRPVMKYEEIEENRKNGRMSALLTLEEGEICTPCE